MPGKKNDKRRGSRKDSDQSNEGQRRPSSLDVAALIAKWESQVKVIHGANDDTFDGLVGCKVADVRHSLTEAFGIPADAVSLVNGNLVDGEYVLKTNDVLEFIKKSGVKPTGSEGT